MTAKPPTARLDVKELNSESVTEQDATSADAKHDPDSVNDNVSSHQTIDTNVQAGVQKVEAVTLVWSLKALVTAYVMIWFVYFVQGLITGVTAALLPYLTSDFAAHSLIPTTAVLSQVVGGVTNLCIAKILDVFGRPHGFLLCASFAVVGLVMAASCNGVEAFAASQVFYTVGVNGVGYCLSVFIADTSSLRHRGLMQALLNSPYIITAWLAGPVSTAFLQGSGWRWAFGMESILLPGVALPLFGWFMYHYRMATRQGILPETVNRDQTFWKSVLQWYHEFDLVGLLLISAGFALFLLPFNLYTLQAKGWGSPMIICFLVLGALLLAAFPLWEKYFARTGLTPWRLLRDRTVLGACMTTSTLFLSTACWNSYFGSYLQVVNNLSITSASYVVQSGTVIQIVTNIVTGTVISLTGRYKPISMFVAVPFIILGTGLLIYFREPTQYVGYIVMSYAFINIGFGILMITVEVAILAAAAEQQYFAITIALLNLFGYVGNAIGLTVSSGVWQATLPLKLALFLPTGSEEMLANIYGSIEHQLAYDWDSTTRLAIQHAYTDTWRLLLIVGASVWTIGLVALLTWKDMNVKGLKQNKGQVI